MTNSWLNPSSGNWFSAANWSDGLTPQDRAWDSVFVGNSAGMTLTVSYESASSTQLNVLTVGTGATLAVSVTDGSNTVFCVNSLTINSGGALSIDTSSPVTLGSNPTVDGTLTISGNPAISINSRSVQGSGTLILDGTTLGDTNTPFQMGSSLTTVLENGAAVYINNATNGAAGKQIVFGDDSAEGTPSQIVFSDYNQTVSTPITGFDASSVITIAKGSAAPISATFVSNGNGTYSLKIAFDQWGNGITLTDVAFGPNSAVGTPTIVTNADGSWSVVNGATGYNRQLCFLAGTKILTPKGEKIIEDLRIGDEITTYVHGRPVTQPVVWIGTQHMTANPSLPLDQAGYPVRVVRNALGDGIPAQDLLITPEHCLFLNDSFVPVRMLVNGRSIFYDRGFPDYDYYHVETRDHSIISANGALTESYLATGNRHTFHQHGTVAQLGGPVRSWSEDAAASLVVSRDFVEPIFNQLEKRADALGLSQTVQSVQLTDDPDLHLLTPNGYVIRKIREAGGAAIFMIPPGVTEVSIVSRTSRPSDTIGPFVDDRRHLGVLVGAIRFFDADVTHTLKRYLTDETLRGWNNVEDGTCRWTDGYGRLPLPPRRPDAIGMLSIQIRAGGPYRMDDETASALIVQQHG
ncbi:Hint domain-containing protein [Gluconobacter morbifer]|uniref:Hedgehog/Intein (Hint) domain-containing protein n=1 Tax=Gluconobacter morbifer G707 TaxID=1088869 RepID=G6XFR7_9PROT|nr:Hint domain-containing protein [Gluconobacter morbifer]EHH69025.1 hypothetical protein GMO_03320 [Gluconobacter morbifer G707]